MSLKINAPRLERSGKVTKTDRASKMILTVLVSFLITGVPSGILSLFSSSWVTNFTQILTSRCSPGFQSYVFAVVSFARRVTNASKLMTLIY